MQRPVAVASASALVFLFACSSTNSDAPGSSGGGTGGGASAQQISGCKHGCDKMKFFNCSSAAEQARCYEDCDKASPKQIETFTGCAEMSVCDPECRTSITPAPSSGGGGGGASAESCATACQKLVTCNFIKVGDKDKCVGVCQKEAYQYQIDCVASNACDAIPKACGGGTTGGSSEGTSGTSGGGDGTDFDVKRCQTQCDQSAFFKCIDASKQATCRDKCASVSASKRDGYTACMNAAGVDCKVQTDCYSQLTQ